MIRRSTAALRRGAIILALLSNARAADLAPESLANTLYSDVPQSATPSGLPPPASVLLTGTGICYTVSSGVSPLFNPRAYRWRKTGVSTGILEFGEGLFPLQMNITFGAPGVGIYRTTGSGSVVTGTISFVEVPLASAAPSLPNLSMRTVCRSSEPVIQGFVVGGGPPRRVLVRVVGPSLAAFGVSNPALTTELTVFRGDVPLGSNSGWGGTLDLAAAFSAVGAFALVPGSQDSALMLTLEPGSYTVQARGEVGRSILIEVYYVE